jgi:Fe-S cluster assembly iron-binding protein IscA
MEKHTPVKVSMLSTSRMGEAVEYVRCSACDSLFRATILEQLGARRPLSQAQREAEQQIAADPTRIVSFTAAALDAIRRRLLSGNYDADTAVRLSADPKDASRCVIQFDTLELNDADFMQRERELFIVIDRRELSALRGGTIDYRDNGFFLDFVATVMG